MLRDADARIAVPSRVCGAAPAALVWSREGRSVVQVAGQIVVVAVVVAVASYRATSVVVQSVSVALRWLLAVGRSQARLRS